MAVSHNGSFAEATAVNRRADGSGYDIDLDPGWAIGDKPNGGYLTATLARAAVLEAARAGVDHPHPLAVSTTFLRAPDAGPAAVEVTVLRAGRGASQLQATLRQHDRLCVTALLTLGTLTDDAAWWDDLPVPDLPSIEDCLLLPDTSPVGVPIHLMRNVHERLDPSTLAWGAGKPAGRGELRGYAAFADGTPWEPLSVLLALDCYPPATFDLGTAGWVPTLELTCYVRGVPAAGPLRVRQRAQLVQGSRVDEVCEVWDSSGRLVGQATQLAGVRTPDGPPAARSPAT